MFERQAEGDLDFEIDHCWISMKQLDTLKEFRHTYGISELGLKVIQERYKFWQDRDLLLAALGERGL